MSNTAIRTGELFDEWRATYRNSHEPIRVNFRELVPGLRLDRSTHLLHPYPAKLLAHIPHFLMMGESVIPKDAPVLDPFCGSGTVLLEAVLSGRPGLGVDSNPLACLIASVKLSRFDKRRLVGALDRLFQRLPDQPTKPLPNVVNLRYWFYPHVVRDLARLSEAIAATRDPQYRDFFSVCLSATLRHVSLADPRLSVPVRLTSDQYAEGHRLHAVTKKRLASLKTVDVLKRFKRIALENIDRVWDFAKSNNGSNNVVLRGDARRLEQLLPKNRVGAVVTSPPYVGAQKYARATSHSLGWLGFLDDSPLASFEAGSVGREHFPKAEYTEPVLSGIEDADRLLDEIRTDNPLRAHISATYLNEMRDALRGSIRALRPGGRLVLVSSPNVVAGRHFPTHRFLRELVVEEGLSCECDLVDAIKSRGLMTRRNRTAAVIEDEHVMIFRKKD